MYSFLQQPVQASALCFVRDADSFFAPTSLAHTGFAWDGYHYTAGVKDGGQASWATEGISDTSGALPTFPQECLVIVSRACVYLLDATTEDLDLWKLFYLCDSFGYTDNPSGGVVGYLGAAVNWNNGMISVTMLPDVGSVSGSPNVITFDFVRDAIYAETRQSQ